MFNNQRWWGHWPYGRSLFGRWLSETYEISGQYSYVNLGGGHDKLIANGFVRYVDMGSEDDSLTLYSGAGHVRMGLGRDRVTLHDHAEYVNGGWGHDTVKFEYNVTDVDIHMARFGQIKVSDKLTGETTTLAQFESFEFKDATFTRADLQQFSKPTLQVADGTGQAHVNDPDPSVSVVWSRALHTAIAESDQPSGPTIAARAMAMVHTAMYDAWASFDATAARVSVDVEGDNAGMESRLLASEANMVKAMSYAAYNVLVDLYPDMVETFVSVMKERYGLDPAGDGSLAYEVGLDAAQDLLAARASDGSNQAGGYADTSGYTPINTDTDNIKVIDRWTPDMVADADQMFLTPHWGQVAGFSVPQSGGANDFTDLTPPPPKAFLAEAYADSSVDLTAGTITLSADAVIDGVSYAAGSTVAISKAMIGTVINADFIAQALEVVQISANLTDKHKVIAEFWEDGPGTSYPPGAGLLLAEYVSARDNNNIGTDAKLFMAVSNAQLDASIVAWESKLKYDYARPVLVIQTLGKLGLIGELGFDEITGQAGHVITAWAGPEHGVATILAENFVSYQQPGSDPSPPFAEYVSGHSTFSASAAEVMKLMTGSDYLGTSVTINPHSSRFEPGTPGDPVTLYWETFSDTAQQSGISRLYGGIHFADGNEQGLALGAQVGQDVFNLAQAYFNGTAGDEVA